MSESFFKEGEELLEWGPVPGALLTMSLFLPQFFEGFGSEAGEKWPKFLILLKDGRFVWLNDLSELQRVGEKMFRRHILVDGWREKFDRDWQRVIGRMQRIMQELDELDLSSLSDEELARKAEEFKMSAESFEAVTILPELANYGAESYLERQLDAFVPADQRAEVLHALTAPEHISFNQREEMELFETDDVRAHQQKYSWLQNGFGADHELPVSFFGERKEHMAGKKPYDSDRMLREIREGKRRVQEKYSLPNEIMTMAKEICLTIVMQDERKKYNYMGARYADLIIREVARRFGHDSVTLQNAWMSEVIDIIRGDDLPELLVERGAWYGFEVSESGWEVLPTERVQKYWEKYVEKSRMRDRKEISGTVACRGEDGTTVGRVRVVHDPKGANMFREGEILVAAMTSPDFVVAMRKAAAIVTNFGGLTSHAAIVSRELGKPCIIGTKVATQVLKDGDEVEVDADRGVVKVVERARS